MEKHHHLFVQGMMSRKFVNKTEFMELYRMCLEQNDALHDDYNTAEAISAFMKIIRKALKELHNDIRKRKDELTGEAYYVYVVSREFESNADNLYYKKSQREYFMILLEHIMTSDNGCLPSTRALNLVKEMEISSISITTAEEYLKQFEECGWILAKRGKLYLGVSALTEFEQYIKENFEEAKTCDLCHELVIYGTLCGNCDNRFHSYCLKSWVSKVKKHECPKCQSDLSEA